MTTHVHHLPTFESRMNPGTQLADFWAHRGSSQFIIDYYDMQTRHPHPYLTSLHTYYLLVLLY